MGEILKNWIQTRVGVMIDLTPEMFGHCTRDGTLLAQILHSYDLINRDQLETIVHTQDPALCRVNLKHLMFWLRFLGIECDDESITDISCVKGATSLRLFYKLYLSLERKDRLHFITLQKERETFVPTSKKFEVTVVSEDPPPYEPSDHPLCAKLVKGIADRQGVDFPAVLRQARQKRESLEKPVVSSLVVQDDEHACTPQARKHLEEKSRQEETEELDQFAHKHRVRGRKLESFEDEVRQMEAEKEEFRKGLLKATGDPEAGKAYVEELKCRAKCAETTAAIKSQMQKALLWKLWEQLENEQNQTFDEEIARRTLDHSRYEKQLVSKLFEVREQKNQMTENYQIVENMTMKASEMEHRETIELEKDLESKKQRDAEAECERMCELRRRLFEMKVEKMWRKHTETCRQVVDDLTSIALNIDEYRRVNEGEVPWSLLSEWKAMFLKCEPIVDYKFVKRYDDKDIEVDPNKDADDWCAAMEKTAAQREILFEDYLESNSPWDQATLLLGEEEREMYELGQLVLGYAVHRLLNALYPRPPNRAHALMSGFKSVAVLLGITNPELHRSIEALLERTGIRLVRMEDAINHCLQKYKDEMSDVEFIDTSVIAATNETMRKKLRERRRSTRSARSDRSSRATSIVEARKSLRIEDEETKTTASKGAARTRAESKNAKTQEKETQTPRNIPFDDLHPVLTDAAYIGKWVYEFLTLGEPIGDELATKVLLEYLQSMTDAKGWALIDYPDTYEQMSRLEMALTGVAAPPDSKPFDFQDATIEEIESLPPRIVFYDPEDPFASKRRSRLVPDPIANRDEGATKSTFVTLFVRLAQKPKDFQPDRSYEPVTADTASIDKYYASRKLAYKLYYSSLDSYTLKELARLVIGEPLQKKPSEELFGDALDKLKDGTGQQAAVGSKAPVVRRLLFKTEEDIEVSGEGSSAERLSTGSRDTDRDFYRSDWTLETSPAKPGESRWRWIDLPLSAGLLENLAKLWECLENAYVNNTREMLYLKCIRVASVVPYREFVTGYMNEFVKRPDNKQDLLEEFHKAFNAVDPDARHDLDVKCELHRRVADFQATLWNICDQRKQEAEEERRRLISEHWTVLEASILYNVFVGVVQAELDRFIDTMRLIEDYYLGMLKKPLSTATRSKIVLNRAEVEVGEPLRFEEPPVEETPVDERTDRIDRKKDRSGSKGKVITLPPAAIDLNALRKQIDVALINKDNRFQEVDECLAFSGILENVRYARNIVDSLSTAANELVKKEQLTASKLVKDLTTDPGDSTVARTSFTGEDFVLEWHFALTYEINRVRLKLDAIVAVARMDVYFLLNTLQQTFHKIYDAIVDRYRRETRSVNEVGNVFCFAIEEGRMIENEMLLENDQFIVRSNVFVAPVDLKRQESKVKEAVSGSRFLVTNLARLAEIFRRVAPYGTITERGFVYILQDLTSHGRDEGEPMLLPCCWHQLRVGDVSKLVRYLFERVDHIDWREFIVYALDLPWPSVQDLLIARERFRRQDPELRETVSRTQYHHTSLWFLDYSLIDSDIHDLLSEDFHKAIEQLYDEELHGVSQQDNDSNIFSVRRSFMVGEPGSIPEETLRRSLAKELLCRMYAIDRHTINYTALLLTFCKHRDPKEGFGMALALALGNRVCTDMEEGEKYMEQVYERKRLGLDWRHMSCNEALEVTRSIIDRLLNLVTVLDFEGEEMKKDSNNSTTSSNTYSSSVEFEGEMSSLTDSNVERRSEMAIYWIPFNQCLTVLAAALPWHVLQPDIIGKCTNLRERLCCVYRELRDEYLDHQKDVALAHRLLNHDFIKQLLNSVSNFTVKDISEEVQRLLRVREQSENE